MYLTRMILNPRSRRVQRELASPYELHRTLMRAFAAGYERGDERVLYRVDAPRDGLGVTLLAQSRHPPDWAFLQEPGAGGYLLPTEHPNPETKAFAVRLAAGQILAFRLRANPTVKRAGKRMGLYREDEQRAWLERKGEAGGFCVLRANVAQEGRIGDTIRRDGRGHRITLLSVRYDGLLQVVDPPRLVAAVEAGIGSAKGLGFGLLSLAPAG